MDEEKVTQTIAEIREWLVRIDTNQSHQTKLLETLNAHASSAFEKADKAESVADEALQLAKKNEQEFKSYVKDEKTGRRWLMGVLVSVGLALLPVFNHFYF